jgi:hypothetical protein
MTLKDKTMQDVSRNVANLFVLLQQLLWCVWTSNSWTTLVEKNIVFLLSAAKCTISTKLILKIGIGNTNSKTCFSTEPW